MAVLLFPFVFVLGLLVGNGLVSRAQAVRARKLDARKRLLDQQSRALSRRFSALQPPDES